MDQLVLIFIVGWMEIFTLPTYLPIFFCVYRNRSRIVNLENDLASAFTEVGILNEQKDKEKQQNTSRIAQLEQDLEAARYVWMDACMNGSMYVCNYVCI